MHVKSTVPEITCHYHDCSMTPAQQWPRTTLVSVNIMCFQSYVPTGKKPWMHDMMLYTLGFPFSSHISVIGYILSLHPK